MPRLLICFACLIFFVPDNLAQTPDTSFSLLWFKGKKLNDSTLLTPGGRRVNYQPTRGRAEIGLPNKNNVFDRMKQMLQQGGQRRSALGQQVLNARHGTLKIGFIYHINRAMEEVDRSTEKLAGTNLELTVEEGRRMPLGESDEVPAYIELYYNEVIQLITKLSNNPGIPEPPAPPDAGLDYCYPCDAKRQEAYKQQAALFRKYIEEEGQYMQKAIAVMHYFAFRKSKNLPYDSAAESKMVPRMNQAMRIILNRIGGKLVLAWKQYKNDAGKLPFLAEQMVAFVRNQELIGINAFEGFPTGAEVTQQILNAAMKQVSKAKSDRDYRILLNVRWIVGLYRTAELLGADQSAFDLSIVDFLRINQFEMTVQADATTGNDKTELTASMSGKNLFGAVPDSNCLLKWTLLAPDSTKMTFTLEDAKMQLEKEKGIYTGTNTWKASPANLQLDFCKEEKDTALLYGFLPHNGVDAWTVQGRTMSPAAIINSVFMTCFMDVDRVRAMAADPGLQARLVQQMQEKHKEFMKAYQASGKDPSKMSPKELEKMAEAMNASKDIANIVQMPTPYSFLCKEKLRNLQKVVFDAKLNGKELFPENKHIKHAIFTVKMEHVVD